MTRSEKAKDFLTKAKFSILEIEILKKTLAEESRRAELFGNKYKSSENYKAFTALINRIIAEQEAVLQQARDVIGSIPDEQCREVLTLHYLDRLTMEEVAERMFYSWRMTNRIQAKAFACVASLMGLEDD